MDIDKKSQMFADIMKGEKCKICTFDIEWLANDFVEVEIGYVHKDCIKEEVHEDSGQMEQERDDFHASQEEHQRNNTYENE